MKPFRHTFIPVAVALGLGSLLPAGCSDASTEDDSEESGGAGGSEAEDGAGGSGAEDGARASGGGSMPPRQALSFEELYTTVFVPGICGDSACHGEETKGGRLDLSTPEIAFDALSDMKAQGPQCVSTGLMRVASGAPEESLLYTKLFKDLLPCGRLMPPTATIIPDEHKALVANWIEAGGLWEATEF